MFHTDISFTQKEKAEQFGIDAKNFIATYREAFDFVRYAVNEIGRYAS
jgi:hypothetical protein